MPTLPTGFLPIATSYTSDDPGGVVREDGGWTAYALQYDRTPQRYTIRLELDSFQLAVWTAFYHRIVYKGALPFDMQMDSGLGMALHTVNIIPGSYSTSRIGGLLTAVVFIVETESQVYN